VETLVRGGRAAADSVPKGRWRAATKGLRASRAPRY